MGMAGGGPGASRGDLIRLFDGGSVAGLGDGELLGRFAEGGDGAAFEALVARLGPMVLGVCRRILADPHDVDDAFQAIDLPPGRYDGLSAAPVSTSSRFVRIYLKPLVVAPGPKLQPLELRMKPGCEILLEAVDAETGRGIPGIRFEIARGPGQPWTALRTSTFQLSSDEVTVDGKLRALIAPDPGKDARVRVLGTYRGDPTVPAPPPLPGDGLPFEALPKQSEPFEPSSGKTVKFRFELKRKG